MARAKKLVAPAMTQVQATESDLSQHPLAQPAVPAATDNAPGAEATPGAAEGASALAAPGPEAPEAGDTREAANNGPADAGADLAATPAALPDQGAAAGATVAGIEAGGLAQELDIEELRLKVTARASKTCARLLWLEGQERTFLPTDLDPDQITELDEDPDFELDFFKL
jgi:hypothetical protein